MPLFRKSVSSKQQSTAAHQSSSSTSSLFRSLNDDLRQAAAKGDSNLVVDLIKRGAKFVPNKEGRTALHIAVVQGHIEIVKTLIEHGCDLNSQDKMGYTAVHRAVLEGHSEIVRLLAETNLINVDKQDFVQENTALHDASFHGYSSIVEILVAAKSNVYVRNKTGSTALHLACQNGHNRSARLLVQNGCKPDVKDKYDDTPLHTSCRYIHAGVTRVLLSVNANANEQNKNGDTPLHLACNLGQKKISRMLLESNAKVDIKNKQGETPIDIAVRKQLSDLVEILKTSAKIQKSTNGDPIVPVMGTAARTSRTKIRERLQAAKDAGSTWQLLFQDWSPYGSDNRQQPTVANNNNNSAAITGGGNNNNGGNGQQRTCPHLYPIDSGFANPVGVSPSSLKPIEENGGEQYCLDLAGNLRKTPVACYCAPFFYHLAKHSNDAHMELLEEIDACQSNLSNEISDLRQVTEKKIDDLNRAVKCHHPRPSCLAGGGGASERTKPGWHRLLSTTKRRLYCAAAAAAATTTNQRTAAARNHQYHQHEESMVVNGRLVRSKSESEIETDIERGRTHAMVDDLIDSDSASNASDDLYFDRRFLLRSRYNNNGRATTNNQQNAAIMMVGGTANFCGTLSRPIRTSANGAGANQSINNKIGNGNRFVPLLPPSTPISQQSSSSYGGIGGGAGDTSVDGASPRGGSFNNNGNTTTTSIASNHSFDETIRQFNKIVLESDSFQESTSCATPTTTTTGSSSRHCTPDTSIRSSIYSSQSAGSYLSTSQLSNSKSLQPSLDSGYGGSTGVAATTTMAANPNESTFQSTNNNHWRVNGNHAKWTPPPPPPIPVDQSKWPSSNNHHQIVDQSSASKWMANKRRAEAETQTDAANNNNSRKFSPPNNPMADLHEYTELECMLRTTTTNHVSSRPPRHFDHHNHRHQLSSSDKPPPVLPIPPPPRKPLPPLPIGSIDSSPPKRSAVIRESGRATRYHPNNACLSTNV